MKYIIAIYFPLKQPSFPIEGKLTRKDNSSGFWEGRDSIFMLTNMTELGHL